MVDQRLAGKLVSLLGLGSIGVVVECLMMHDGWSTALQVDKFYKLHDRRNR